MNRILKEYQNVFTTVAGRGFELSYMKENMINLPAYFIKHGQGKS